MKVVITGGAGFLGQRLAASLLKKGALDGRTFEQIVLLDVVAAPGPDDARIKAAQGDIADPSFLKSVIEPDVGAVFHLAAIVSGQAEADFDLGMRVNLDASRHLLEACRAAGHRPRVVFTSSVAVYGGELPAVVRDDTALTPRSSYGAQKAMAELLLSDYARKGFVDGRILRLPTIVVRPGKPNKAASSFVSGIIREPLNGEEAVCPVAPDTRLWLLSPRRAVEALIHGGEIGPESLGDRRAVNLPGLSVSVADMLAALGRAAGPDAVARIRFEPDAAIARIVGGWPGAWDTSRAEALGFAGDADFDSVIRAYIEDQENHSREPSAFGRSQD
jgi:nucleoside-diphosphate-sugar epimerase